MSDEISIQVIFTKLLNNASRSISESSLLAKTTLIRLTQSNSQQTEVFLTQIFNREQILSTSELMILTEIFNHVCKNISPSIAVFIFNSLQSSFVKAKTMNEQFLSLWRVIASNFISSSQIAEEIDWPKPNSPFALITLEECAKYFANDILLELESFPLNIISSFPQFSCNFLIEISKYCHFGSEFLSRNFNYLYSYFIEQPNAQALNAMNAIFQTLLPYSCPVSAKTIAIKLSEMNVMSFSTQILVSLLSLLQSMAIDNPFICTAIDFSWNVFQFTSSNITTPSCSYPIESIDPSYEKFLFIPALSSLIELSKHSPELIFYRLAKNTPLNFVLFKHLFSKCPETEIQKKINSLIISTTIAYIKNVHNESILLSDLLIDIMFTLDPDSEQVAMFSRYILRVASSFSNSYYLEQIPFFQPLISMLFKEVDLKLLPSTIYNIFNNIRNKPIENHPFTESLRNHSSSERALIFIRIFSSLMTPSIQHKYIQPLLEALKIFIEVVSPSNFKYIHSFLSDNDDQSHFHQMFTSVISAIKDEVFQKTICDTLVIETQLQSNPSIHITNCLFMFSQFSKCFSNETFSLYIFKLSAFICMIQNDEGLLTLAKNVHHQLLFDLIRKNIRLTNISIQNNLILLATLICHHISDDQLISCLNSQIIPLISSLINKRDHQIYPKLLEFMSELFSRITYNHHFDIKIKNDMFFNYIISNAPPKLTPLYLKVIRFFIQVPPCITLEQFSTIRERFFSPNDIRLQAANLSIWNEIREILLAVWLTKADIFILVSIIEILLPIIDSETALSLLHYLLLISMRSLPVNKFTSKFTDKYSNLPSSVFYKSLSIHDIPIQEYLVHTISAAANDKTGKAMEIAEMLNYLIKKPDNDLPLLEQLSSEEQTTMAKFTINCMKTTKRCYNYSYVLSLLMDSIRLQNAAEICSFIISGKWIVHENCLIKLAISYPEFFVQSILKYMHIENTKKTTEMLFNKVIKQKEALEVIQQQLCILLPLSSPNSQIRQLLFKCILLMDSLPMVYRFQVACTLIIYYFESDDLNLNFPELQAAMKNIDNTFNQTEFNQDIISSCIQKMVKNNQNLLIDVMNFIMSTQQLNTPQISRSIALFSGEVCSSIELTENDSAAFNLYYSSLLSFSSLFDEKTSILSVTEISKVLTKSNEYFPIPFISRTLQTLLNVAKGKKSVVPQCRLVFGQFCSKFVSQLTEKMHVFIFELLMELCYANEDVSDVLSILLRCETKYHQKYLTIANLVSIHFESDFSDIPELNSKSKEDSDIQWNEKKNIDDERMIISLFFEANESWMKIVSLKFMRDHYPDMVHQYMNTILQLFDSKDPEMSKEAILTISSIFSTN